MPVGEGPPGTVKNYGTIKLMWPHERKQWISPEGKTPSTTLMLKNGTPSNLALYWVDFKGNLVFYKNLKAKSSTTVTQQTYVGHVWALLNVDYKYMMPMYYFEAEKAPNNELNLFTPFKLNVDGTGRA